MATKIRLCRIGAKKNPIYRMVIADARAPRDGCFIEQIGYYDPSTNPVVLNIDEEKAAISRLNKAALDDVVYAPTGFFLGYTAWRKNVSGIVKGPLPFFWGVSKTA